MKRKPMPVVVLYKDGRVYRRFGSVQELGKWLFARSPGRKGYCRRLALTQSLVNRAANAYVAYLMGTSRIRPC